MITLSSILLQVATPSPEEIQAKQDSIIRGLEMMLQTAQNDPKTFWQEVVDSMIRFGLQVLAAFAIFVVGIVVIRWVQRILKRTFERRKTEPTIASFVSSFISISLTILLIILTVGALGVNTTSLAALLAAGGMAIGMALSGTVQNFAGGIMILAFKPFKADDFIEAQGTMGKVIEVNITATKILTTDNKVIILPNGSLSNGSIINYTARPLRRVDLEVSVSYGVDAKACKAAIRAILDSDKRVLQADTDMDEIYKELQVSAFQLSVVNYRMDSIPEPFVGLKSLNSNDITFVVRAWVRSTDYWDVFYDLQERFYTELPPQGFTFAYPHVDVTMIN